MARTSIARDVGQLEVVMDTWTAPFWKAAAERQLLVPRCGDCGHFRWPPGPFCPECRSQATEWVSPGAGVIYSFTILPFGKEHEDGPQACHVPALIRFPQAGDIVLLGSLIEARLDAIRIDAPVQTDWLPAANTNVPAFRLAD